MSTDLIDRPTVTSTDDLFDHPPEADAPDQDPEPVTPGLLEALRPDLASRPEPEPIDWSAAIIAPPPDDPNWYSTNYVAQAPFFGSNLARVPLDFSIYDLERLADHQKAVEDRQDAIREHFTGLIKELRSDPEAGAVRTIRQRVAKADADEAKLHTQLAELEAGHRDALLAGEDPDYPMKQADGIRARLRSLAVLKDAIRPVLAQAEGRYADAVKAGRDRLMAALTAEATVEEKAALDNLAEVMFGAAARLDLARRDLAELGRLESPYAVPFAADVD